MRGNGFFILNVKYLWNEPGDPSVSRTIIKQEAVLDALVVTDTEIMV
ncbi:hypothetical protein STRDD13_00149 [Streptococcus sp. DD13]|nr:hypothetical protein STRDD13_00149 [Streptococcus sp. DD13]